MNLKNINLGKSASFASAAPEPQFQETELLAFVSQITHGLSEQLYNSIIDTNLHIHSSTAPVIKFFGDLFLNQLGISHMLVLGANDIDINLLLIDCEKGNVT